MKEIIQIITKHKFSFAEKLIITIIIGTLGFATKWVYNKYLCPKDVEVYYNISPIILPAKGNYNSEICQLLTIVIKKNIETEVLIDNIKISPYVSLIDLTYLKSDNIDINNKLFDIKKNESNNFFELNFKGIKRLPSGENKLTLFCWGQFGNEYDIDVNIASSNLGIRKGLKREYVYGFEYVIVRYWPYVLISIFSIVSICYVLAKRADK